MTFGQWSLKFEGAHRERSVASSDAYAVGVEYALVSVGGTPIDVTIAAEYVNDQRRPRAVPGFLEHDWAVGMRVALNDARSTEGKFGLIVDREAGSQAWALELGSRIADDWRLSAQARRFLKCESPGSAVGDPRRQLHRRVTDTLLLIVSTVDASRATQASDAAGPTSVHDRLCRRGGHARQRTVSRVCRTRARDWARSDVLPIVYQLMLVSHIVCGVLAFGAAAAFVALHMPRMIRSARRTVRWAGIALAALCVVLLVSGLFILSEANSRENAWISSLTRAQRSCCWLPTAFIASCREIRHDWLVSCGSAEFFWVVSWRCGSCTLQRQANCALPRPLRRRSTTPRRKQLLHRIQFRRCLRRSRAGRSGS